MDLSGLLRHALDLPRLEIEAKARGRAVINVVKEVGEVSVLYAAWGDEDDVKHLSFRCSYYLWHDLARVYENGSWKPKGSPSRPSHSVTPTSCLPDCEALNSV